MSTTAEKWTIFGERLKAELERQGMSLRQFADKTGITLTTACRYVHSQRTPRATEILKAAKALGTTCDYMLGLSNDPHKTRDGWTKARNLQPTCNLASDCISRQALCEYALNQKDKSVTPNDIMRFPSAQPEKRTEKRTETHACDCISRQAAIDALKNERSDWNCDYNVPVDHCIDAIYSVPSAQPEPHWIPCSERLPDSTEYVLVTDYGETNIGRRFCGRWWLDYCGDKMKDVTAWMPLPEPYREGAQE